MTSTSRFPWLTMLREAAAVLAAILVAFALDAWWEDRVEQADLRVSLETLRVEVASNVRSIDALLDDNTRSLDAAVAVASMTDASLAAMTDSEVVQIGGRFAQQQIFTPERAALTAIVQGGGLEDLDDFELRTGVAGLVGDYDEVVEEQQLLASALMGVADAWVRAVGGAGGLGCIRNAVRPDPDPGLARDCIGRMVGAEELSNQSLVTMLAFQVHHTELGFLRSQLATVEDQLTSFLGEH